MNSAKHILIITSFIPSSDTDPVPAFVKDQINALKTEYPDLDFSVLAPHDAYSSTWLPEIANRNPENYKLYRFHYFWPYSLAA